MNQACKASSRVASIFACLPLLACATSGGGTGFPDDSGSAGNAGDGGSGAQDGGGGLGGASFGGSGGTSGGAGSAGDGGATGGTGGIIIDAGPPLSVSGNIVELSLSTAPPNPVPDMKVCVYGLPSVPCVYSDSAGDYTIVGVPGGNDLLLEYTKTGFYPVLRTITTGSTDLELGSIPYPTVAQAKLFATLVGTQLDETRGQVLAMALKTVVLADGGTTFAGQEGVSAAMTPKSGAGPFYTAANSVPDPTAAATSSNGVGLFANVNPGEVEIEMKHGTKSCQRYADGAWQGSTATASRVPVIAGYLIGGAVLECPP
jgi:hypothetical protein